MNYSYHTFYKNVFPSNLAAFDDVKSEQIFAKTHHACEEKNKTYSHLSILLQIS
jgi:hypothetical protein